MNSETIKKLENLNKLIGVGTVSVDTNAYSPKWESTIQQAVAYKRSGQYDKSVNVYLDIFNKMHCVNSNIVAFLFKTVVCAEEFCLAYKIISLMELFVIASDGPKMPIIPFPGGPVLGYIKWAHTEYREELETAAKKALLNKNTSYLLEYVKPKSGNPIYKFQKSDAQIYEDIKNMF